MGKTGTRISRIGPYRLIEALGRGATATVYLAEAVEEVTGVPVGTRIALKLLDAQIVPGSRLLDRFSQEIELGGALQHIHVARTIDAGKVWLNGQDRYYLAMEYVPGQTLARLFEVEGPQPEGLCRHVGLETARGLQAIHDLGVVHRDIKPANLLLGEDHEVKILDLGVARVLHDSGTLSQIGDFVGSVHYAAPEQFGGGGSEAVDGRADLHALGIVLYEMATGERAFGGKTLGEVLDKKMNGTVEAPSRLQPHLSPFFDALILALVEKDRDRRPATAKLLAQILAEGEASAWWGACVRAQVASNQPRTPLPLREADDLALQGRASDLGVLHAAWDAARQGEGHVVFVQGEEGVGKTRLLHEFVLDLAEGGEDFHYLEGQISPTGVAGRMGALSTAFRTFFDGCDLEAVLDRYLGDSPPLLAAFTSLLRRESPAGGATTLDLDALQSLFVRVMQALASERPTILVLDDVQDASAEGRAVISALVRALPEHRLLLLLAARSEAPSDWLVSLLRERHARRLDLARLGRDAVLDLLAQALGSKHTASAVLDGVIDLSGGNPLFTLELLEAHHRLGNLQRCETGSWVLVAKPKPLGTPPAIRGVIATRLAELTQDDRDLLEVAAVIGPRFDPAIVASVLERPLLDVLRALGRLERNGRLLRSEGGMLRFDPQQVQTILQDDVSLLLREAYHAAIGLEIEKKPGEDGARAVHICQHLLRGNRGGSALRHLDAALEHLRDTYASEEALDLLERALDAVGLVVGIRRARLLDSQAELLGIAGRHVERGQALLAALDAEREDPDPALRARLFLALGDNERRAGQPEQALERAREALAIAQELEDLQLKGGVAILLGNVLLGQGNVEEGAAQFEQALALALESGDLLAEAKATGSLARAQIRDGDYEKSLDNFRRSLEMFERAGDLRLTGVAANNLGAALLSTASRTEAPSHLQRAYDIARQVGSRRGQAQALGNLGLIAAHLGRPAEALRLSEQDLALHRELGDVRHECTALNLCAEAARALGEYGLARRRVQEALALSRRLGFPEGEALSMQEAALLAADEGRRKEALDGLVETQAFAAAHGLSDIQLAACCDAIGQAYWLGEHDRVDALCRQAEELLGDSRDLDMRIVVDVYRAIQPGGDIGPVVETLEREGPRVALWIRIQAWELLWRARGSRSHLEKTWRLYRSLMERLTPEQQSRLIERGADYRRLEAAGKEAGLTP